jgi:hypothetical protein
MACQSGRPRSHVPGQQDIVLARKMSIIATYVSHIPAVKSIGRLPSQPTLPEKSARSIQDSITQI